MSSDVVDVVTEARDLIDPREQVRLLKEFIAGNRDLTRDQIRACEVLLRKRLPDLSAQQLSGDPKAPVTGALTIKVVHE